VLIGMGTWGILFLKSENSDLQDRRDNINAAIVEQQLSTADLTALEKQAVDAEAPVTDLDSLLVSVDDSRKAIKADLDIVYDYASECGVSLETVNTDATGGIKISGSAATEDAVLRYYGRLLYDSGEFSTVMIGKISVIEDGASFSMELSG